MERFPPAGYENEHCLHLEQDYKFIYFLEKVSVSKILTPM